MTGDTTTETTTGGVSVDYGTMFSGVATEVMDGLTAIMPIAIPIFGTVLAISIGIKVFGKLAKKG